MVHFLYIVDDIFGIINEHCHLFGFYIPFITQAVEQNLKDAEKYEAYLCGSPGMIDAAIEVLIKLGMPEEAIFYDKFE